MSNSSSPKLWPDMPVQLHDGTERFRIGLIVQGAGRYWGLTARHVFGDKQEAVVHRPDGTVLGTYLASDNSADAQGSEFEHGASRHIARLRISNDQITPEKVDFDVTWPRETLQRHEALGATIVSAENRKQRIGGIVETGGRVKLSVGESGAMLVTDATFVRLEDPRMLGPGLAGTLVIAEGGHAVGLGLGTVQADQATELVVCPLDAYLKALDLRLWAPKGMKWSDTDARLDIFSRGAPFDSGPDLGRIPNSRPRTNSIPRKSQAHGFHPQKIARFLEVSNDIYRNGDDARFADDDGELIYCFDSTTFALFYDTAQWRGSASSFHSLPYSRSKGKSYDAEIETQASLIAAEHLLGPDPLPGARNNAIHLTPWHKAELASHLRERFDARPVDEPSRTRILREVQRKIEVNRLYAGERSAEGILNRTDSLLLDNDVASLKDSIDDAGTLDLYRTTRIAASVLADTEASERLDQIHRLVSDPICKRIRSLSTSFLPGQSDLAGLRTEANNWFRRIQDEADRGARHSGQPSSRQVGAIWSDARSLAFLQWISENRLLADQRLVFVTGDSVVFDAYRRWWSDVQDDRNKGPFMLRRPFQYTPLCNLSDAQSDLATADVRARIGALFARIQEVIEISLSPFNLAYGMGPGRGLGPLSIQRGREDLARRMSDRAAGDDDSTIKFFTRDLADTWLEEQETKLDEITGHLRDLERIGIGFFRQKIRQRLADEEYLPEDCYSGPASGATGQNSLAYWERSLESLARDVRTAWLPKAQAFLKEDSIQAPHAADRIPNTIWYRTASGKSVSDLASGTTARQPGTPVDPDLEQSPEAIFVLASVLALQRQLWWKADEFASHAARAAKNREDLPLGDNYWECLLLQAICKRFRIGAMPWQPVGSHTQPNRRNATSESTRVGCGLVKDAEDILERYIAAFRSEHLHLIRGHSERAALRLFTAVVMFRFGIELADHPADTLLDMGQADLSECLRLSAITEASPELDELKRHFLHNAAAFDVIRFLFAASEEDERVPVFADLADQIAQLQASPMRGNSLLFAEQTCFQILCGKADPSDWPAFERAIASGREAALSIDTVMLDALSRKKDALFLRLNTILERSTKGAAGEQID